MKFRKLPVVVETLRYPGHSIEGVNELMAFEDWLTPLAKAIGKWPLKYRGQSLIIPTLEGEMEAMPGDWIVQGTSGELYPVKPEIFVTIYEPAI